MSLRAYDFFGMKYIFFQDPVTLDIKDDSLLRVIQSVEYTNEIEAIKNIGGDAPGPFMIEGGQPDPGLTMTVTELRAGLYAIAEDSEVTTNAAESGGSVGAFSNTSGTSILDVANGISAVIASITNQANLQAGTYIFKKGASATEIDVYGVSLTDNLTTINNLIAQDVDCSTPGSVEIAAAGITLTVIGTPVFADGDVAVCKEIRPVNFGSNIVKVGSGATPPIVSATFIFPKQTTEDIYTIFVPKLYLPGGLGFGGATREFSEFTINGSPLVADDGSIYTMTQILGSA